MDAKISYERACEMLSEAEAMLSEAAAQEYCCDHAKSAALSERRREVKRWRTWLNDYLVVSQLPLFT